MFNQLIVKDISKHFLITWHMPQKIDLRKITKIDIQSITTRSLQNYAFHNKTSFVVCFSDIRYLGGPPCKKSIISSSKSPILKKSKGDYCNKTSKCWAFSLVVNGVDQCTNSSYVEYSWFKKLLQILRAFLLSVRWAPLPSHSRVLLQNKAECSITGCNSSFNWMF